MDFRGRWALRAAASMPVQIIRGKWCKAPGVATPSRQQHMEQAAPLGHSPTRPPTHPSHVPSVGLVQNLHGAGLPCPNRWTHGMGRPNPPHGRGVSKSVLTWAGSSRAGALVQNLLDIMDGDFVHIFLTGGASCPNPPRHGLSVRPPLETSPRAAASSPRALRHLPAHPLHHGLSRPLSKPCDTSSAKGMRGDIPWWRD